MSNHAGRQRGNLPDTPNGDYVRFMPLGGLDEVGMNCALIECNDSMLMIDCGYTFPEDDFGVDYFLPDWSYVVDNIDKLDGVLVTHGHQDHIGALPFFLQEIDVPIYSGRIALAMLERQLEEKNLADKVDLFPVEAAELLEIGPFTIEFVPVNHSVPNARSISLDTPVGRFIVTGDWKIDQMIDYEDCLDLQTFADLGRDGVRGLFGDSTNAMVPGFSTSEYDVYQGIKGVTEDTDGRVIVAQFSSNLYRLRGVLEVAHQDDRKVLLLGRSLRNNFDIGIETGFIELPDPNMMIRPHEVQHTDDNDLLVVATGSQAEPRASLTRMSTGDHHHITLQDTDTVIISARVIPGNESGIHSMVDNLLRRGANVVQAGDEQIHGSGHACAEELKLMLNLTNPEYLVPVHGNYAMRKRHAELGEQVDVPKSKLIENGDVLEFTHDDAEVIGQIRCGRVIVDGDNVGELEDVEIRDRAKLAQSGIITVFTVLDRNSGEIVTHPELAQRGFISEGEDDKNLLDRAADAARQALEELSNDARRNTGEVEQAVRNSVRRFFRKRIDRKPVVIPIVYEA